MDVLLWGVAPYLMVLLLVGGSIWRYRYDQFGWTTRSSQLYESRLLRIGSPVFHYGLVFVIAGHFVGLVIPHLMRMILGPAHLPLVTASALGGALLLTLADLGSRTIVPNADMPIGMLTALVGGPFFFWLLRRTRKRSGGWG